MPIENETAHPKQDLEPEPIATVRTGWTHSLAAMHVNGDDALIFGEAMATVCDDEEWEWESHENP